MRPKIFKKSVYSVVREIASGSVMTYQEVAKYAGRPNAYRAVGNILNKNYDLTIPCHRVVRSDGKIGGYNRGRQRKILLLTSEGVKF